MMRGGVKDISKKIISKLPVSVTNLIFHNKIYGRVGNVLQISGARMHRCEINFKQKSNRVVLGEGSILKNCRFLFFGSDNTVEIGKNCYLNGATFWVEDDGNVVVLHDKITVQDAVQFACMEGTKISVGEDCMFSSNITLRTGDSHSITDLNGNRTNPSGDITLGNHVWVGEGVVVLKNSLVSDNSIVGTRCVLTGRFELPNVCIAGIPAKVVKQNVNWDRKRIPG